jgi:hypothetical protein
MRAFIASTVTDLAEYRQVVQDVLRDLLMFAKYGDTLGVAPASQNAAGTAALRTMVVTVFCEPQ